MKFDTEMQTPVCNPPEADSGIAPETSAAGTAPDLPLLSLVSSGDSSGESDKTQMIPLFNEPRPPTEQEEPVDPLEAIKALAPGVAEHMKKMLNNTKTPATVKLRILEIILERTYGKVETAVKLSSNAHQSVEASQARIAAMVEKIRFEGEQIRLVFDE